MADLQKVKEALEQSYLVLDIFNEAIDDYENEDKAMWYRASEATKEALAELDAFMERLDSLELALKVETALSETWDPVDIHSMGMELALAAINAIKEQE